MRGAVPLVLRVVVHDQPDQQGRSAFTLQWTSTEGHRRGQEFRADVDQRVREWRENGHEVTVEYDRACSSGKEDR